MENKTLSFEQICQAEKVWYGSQDLQEQYVDLNSFLHACVSGQFRLYATGEDSADCGM